MCGIAVQDVTLPKKTHPSSSPTVQSPFIFWQEKTSNNSSTSPWVQSLCWLCNIFFCFPHKNCETASFLSCPCRLTDRKCVFSTSLLFLCGFYIFWYMIFCSPHCIYYFLFQAFSDVLALSYFHGFIPHSQTLVDNASGLVLNWEIHPGPAGSTPSPSDHKRKAPEMFQQSSARENPFVQQANNQDWSQDK